MRVLIVDDDPIVEASCRRIFAGEGYEVRAVPGAEEALRQLHEESFDLLLVDVIMPEYDGIYLIERIRETWPSVPVLVMSGYPTPETISNAGRWPKTCFIAKPFTPEELLRAAGQLLSERDTGAPDAVEKRDAEDKSSRDR